MKTKELLDVVNKYYDIKKTGFYEKESKQTHCGCGEIFDGRGKCSNCGGKKTVNASSSSKGSIFERRLTDRKFQLIEKKLYVSFVDGHFEVREDIGGNVYVALDEYRNRSNVDGRTKKDFIEYAMKEARDFFAPLDMPEGMIDNFVRSSWRETHFRNSFIIITKAKGLINIDLSIGTKSQIIDVIPNDLLTDESMTYEQLISICSSNQELTEEEVKYLLDVEFTSSSIKTISKNRELEDLDILIEYAHNRNLRLYELEKILDFRIVEELGIKKSLECLDKLSRSKLNTQFSDLNNLFNDMQTVGYPVEEFERHLTNKELNKIDFNLYLDEESELELEEGTDNRKIVDDIIKNPMKMLTWLANQA